MVSAELAFAEVFDLEFWNHFGIARALFCLPGSLAHAATRQVSQVVLSRARRRLCTRLATVRHRGGAALRCRLECIVMRSAFQSFRTDTAVLIKHGESKWPPGCKSSILHLSSASSD